MRTAVIDIGTNSVRLLVADPGLVEVERDLVVTRLGEGVDAARALGAQPMKRTVEAIAGYVSRAQALGAQRVRVVATSAVRDASNKQEFVDAVRAATGVVPEILSGEHEARAGFAGATSDLGGAPVVIVDVGGGSTEFVRGAAREPQRWVSLDIGSVRLTERHIAHDPPLASEVEAVRADARREIARAVETIGAVEATDAEPATLVGLAGTITTLAAVILGLDGYDRARIHHARLSRSGIDETTQLLVAMTSQARRSLPAMPQGREDVIVAGAIVFQEAMEALRAREIVVSERDLLDGCALGV